MYPSPGAYDAPRVRPGATLGLAASNSSGLEPADLQPAGLLHGDPLVGLRDLGRGEARHVIALRHEAGVDAELGLLAGVEVAAEEPEPHGRRRAALGPHHAGRAGAGALAQRAGLEQDHLGQPGPAQEPRGPGADRATTDDDGVRAASAGGRTQVGAVHDADAGID